VGEELVSVTHAKVQDKIDSTDGSIIRQADWNSVHLVNDLPLSVLSTDASGIEFLGSTSMTAAGTQTSNLAIAAREILLLIAHILSLPINADISLRFNADTSANYWGRLLTVTSGATWTNNQQVNQTALPILIDSLSYFDYSILAVILNRADKTKVVCSRAFQGGSGNDNPTSTRLFFDGGEWINTTQQITSIQMIASQNMAANSGFAVWGKNF